MNTIMMKLAAPLGIAIGMLIALVTSALGAPVTIQAPSFEQTTSTMPNGLCGINTEFNKAIDGWHYHRASTMNLLLPSADSYFTLFTTEANNFVLINSFVSMADYAAISQTLGAQYTANTLYNSSRQR